MAVAVRGKDIGNGPFMCMFVFVFIFIEVNGVDVTELAVTVLIGALGRPRLWFAIWRLFMVSIKAIKVSEAYCLC
jgi:hypothetical protein